MREAKTGWQSSLKRLRVGRPLIPIVHSNTNNSHMLRKKSRYLKMQLIEKHYIQVRLKVLIGSLVSWHNQDTISRRQTCVEILIEKNS